MGIVGGGGQAELCTVHERILMPVPERLSWTEAGGTPEVFTTAHDAVFTQGGLLAGERLLVHGGAGGVGTAAIQLGHVAGARVTATVRNPDVREQVAQLGATVIEPEGFAEHGPFDLILELVGAINLADNVKSIDFNGRISIIGTSAGAVGELNLGLLMHKRARIYGSTLRARPLEQKAMTARAVERSVLPALGSGGITVPIAETFALEDAVAAYDRFAAGGKLGKIVLLPDGVVAASASGAAGLGHAARPVAKPVGAVGHVDPGLDAAVVQLGEHVGADPEQLLDDQPRLGQQQPLTHPAVVRGHRPVRSGLGQLRAEPQVGDVGRLAERMGARPLDVGALDEPHVDAGVDERPRVGGRAQQVGLDGRAEPVAQPPAGHLEHAAEDRVGVGGVLGADLDPTAGRERPRDRLQPVGGRRRVDVDGQVAQVQRQPRLGRAGRAIAAASDR